MNDSTLFSDSWILRWKDEINQSDVYKKEGRSWKEPLILRFSGELPNIFPDQSFGFWLDLNSGHCRELRYAEPRDLESCNVILSAELDTWKRIIKEKKDPLFLLMQGGLKLEKGSLMKLTSERTSAKALLDCAHKACMSLNETVDIEEPTTAIQKTPSDANVNASKKSFATARRGLDFDSLPMQLFQKSKTLGIWNPSDISFDEDKRQWNAFSDLEKKVLLHLTSMFVSGEEAVTLDLLPLIGTVAKEGRIEEEIYLTSFLWEEAKHTEFFSIFLREVVRADSNIESFHGKAYKRLFYDELHQALNRLEHDRSPESQLRASITYNMIVEGTLAETGYEAYYNMLTDNDMLPGLREGIGHLKRDESRHIAFGLYFIKRLLVAHPQLFVIMEEETGRLLEMAIDVVHEMFDPYPEMPFGLEKSWYLEYAAGQFKKRIAQFNPSNS